jgi:transposase
VDFLRKNQTLSHVEVASLLGRSKKWVAEQRHVLRQREGTETWPDARKRRSIPLERHEDVLRMCRNGMPHTKIAESFGVSKFQINKIVRTYGTCPHQPYKPDGDRA